MITWRINHVPTRRCGYCQTQIGDGAPFIEVGASKLVRCADCAHERFGEAQPDIIPDDAPRADVPAGVRHQASMAFEETR